MSTNDRHTLDLKSYSSESCERLLNEIGQAERDLEQRYELRESARVALDVILASDCFYPLDEAMIERAASAVYRAKLRLKAARLRLTDPELFRKRALLDEPSIPFTELYADEQEEHRMIVRMVLDRLMPKTPAKTNLDAQYHAGGELKPPR